MGTYPDNMKNMDDAQKSALKQKLEAKKTKLQEMLQNMGEKVHETPNSEDYEPQMPEYGDGEDENAKEVEVMAERTSTQETIEKDLNAIDEALTRIDAGNYGVCKSCGNNIAEERMNALPEALQCINCASQS